MAFWWVYGDSLQRAPRGRGKNHDQPRNLVINYRTKGSFGKLTCGLLYHSLHSLKRIPGKLGMGPQKLAVLGCAPVSWCRQG